VTRLADIPTLLLIGPTGAGKTTLIRRLLLERPASERWAVLLNEQGRAKLESTPGVFVAQVPGGCVCCTAQVELRVALTRLLRESRPARLFIELAAASHVENVLRMLHGPWLAPVLQLGPVVAVGNDPLPPHIPAVRARNARWLADIYSSSANEPR
jgi:G3E family GTPase